MTIGFLAVGTELLDGRLHEKNGYYLARELSEAGLRLSFNLSCGDSIAAIKHSLLFLEQHCSTIIISGGLGPTEDDCTREALSLACSLPLIQDDASLEKIKERFSRRGIEFPETNCKQALFPEGSTIIPNETGTAPGFYFSNSRKCTLVALPGVPSEFSLMFKKSLMPLLLKFHNGEIPESESIYTFGISESEIARRVNTVKLPAEIEISYLAEGHRIVTRLQSYVKEKVKHLAEELRDAIGREFIFSDGSIESLAEKVHLLMSGRTSTLSVAESCTGGTLGSFLTSAPGCSSWFKGGAISYANELKEQLLLVDKELLQKYGAVSAPVARAMASGGRKTFATDYCIAITGVAGPGGESELKPAGTVFIAIDDGNEVICVEARLSGERVNIQKMSALCAMDLFRRKLLDLPYKSFYYREVKEISD